MKFNAIVTGLVMAGVLTTQAYAAQPARPDTMFSNNDIYSLFVDNQQPLQLAVLSAQEMQTTQGGGLLQEAILTQGLAGATTGAYTYMTIALVQSQEMTYENLFLAMASGFAGGAAGGVAGLGASILGPGLPAVASGIAAGVVSASQHP